MALTDKLSAIADAIRGKTGKSGELTLDQMAEEIAGIETGGGSDNFSFVCDNYEIHATIIAVGANTVTNLSTMKSYFRGVLGFDYDPVSCTLLTPMGAINNELIYFGAGVIGFTRFRDGAVNGANTDDSYDLRLAEGAKYHVVFQRWIAP